MNGPDFEKENAKITEFEQALQRAMKRVDVRAETTAKFLALADEAERKRVHAGGGIRLLKLSNGGRILAMPHPRAWMGGAIAAVLTLGCFVGARIHTDHERKVMAEQQAQQQFETAERITDQALARTREQLEQRGIRLEP